ncbi:hypothetical protein B0T14DRAFT_504888 [Immersiella caudata]|uniref:Uncharacterized protein n=1 Tax=Immersiella caudata TaxID=314043 RepID=A0AA39XEX4_9PEZI|nr:hypothetical protein B0T14DRAFT_504888 [Immersiella caudata]
MTETLVLVSPSSSQSCNALIQRPSFVRVAAGGQRCSVFGFRFGSRHHRSLDVRPYSRFLERENTAGLDHPGLREVRRVETLSISLAGVYQLERFHFSRAEHPLRCWLFRVLCWLNGLCFAFALQAPNYLGTAPLDWMFVGVLVAQVVGYCVLAQALKWIWKRLMGGQWLYEAVEGL